MLSSSHMLLCCIARYYGALHVYFFIVLRGTTDHRSLLHCIEYGIKRRTQRRLCWQDCTICHYPLTTTLPWATYLQPASSAIIVRAQNGTSSIVNAIDWSEVSATGNSAAQISVECNCICSHVKVIGRSVQHAPAGATTSACL